MSEMNATPATEAASSDTQDFLSSVGESEKRVRVSGKAVSDEVVVSTKRCESVCRFASASKKRRFHRHRRG